VRILLISKYFPPEWSNTAQLLGELADDLAAHHEVEVIAARAGIDQKPTHASPPGVRVRWIASMTAGGASAPLRLADYLWFTLRCLTAACTSRRPHVIVAMNEPPTASIVGAVAAAVHRCAFVQICHDIYPDITIALGRKREGVVTRIWRGVNRLSQGRAKFVVVVGRDMLEKLAAQGVPREKLHYAPTWASDQVADPGAANAERRARGWDTKFVVMFAGAMAQGHNLGIVADVATDLADIPDLLIVFIGDGPAKQPLLEETKRRRLCNVEFVPRLPKSDAQRLMAVADLHLITLVPGLWGCGAPSKTYGIMAAGRPFIASVDRGSEPARIAEEFRCGFVVPAGSAPALAGTIREARNAALDEMGRRAYSAFIARYERSAATSALSDVFERACSSPANLSEHEPSR
jgi:glycosyltransferase involved in cell wall biosynthesis